MKHFRVATINTPEVFFDLPNGFISISGISSTINSLEFYKNFINGLIDYRNTEGNIQLDMNLQYFNTSTARCLYDIFIELRKREVKGHQVTVNWYYDQFDEDMFEMGKDFEELVELDFKFHPLGEYAL